MAQEWNRGRGNDDHDDHKHKDKHGRPYRRFKTIIKKRPYWSPF